MIESEFVEERVKNILKPDARIHADQNKAIEIIIIKNCVSELREKKRKHTARIITKRKKNKKKLKRALKVF